jgi:two-component system NtrC family sensor kinase
LRNEFNQVILNLIVNAAHAIGEATSGGSRGKGKIRISGRVLGEQVEIRISDTGAGIPDGARARVFEPFFTTKEVGKGTGQGLAIAYSVIVDKHQGSIAFETELNRGTTFVISLPLVAATTSPAEAIS